MIILAIETSCDDTAVAIVKNNKQILFNKILSQNKQHAPYCGVVPEIASRAHMQNLNIIVKESLNKININQIDAIAATSGPGLIGGLIIGMSMAKAMASASSKPFIPINHLEGHALTIRLTSDIKFPYLLLLASGGHSQIYIIKNINNYEKIGDTLDDSIGETFDKTAKMLGLEYPGGPEIEKRAVNGDIAKYKFPRALTKQKNCNFSLSGLKTAIRYKINEIKNINNTEINNICASFQECIAEIIEKKMQIAINIAKNKINTINNVVIAGGVGSNEYIKNRLKKLCETNQINFLAPPKELCTDNAAMIAWAAIEKYTQKPINNINFSPKTRWDL